MSPSAEGQLGSAPPPRIFIVMFYLVLGSAISFLTGRQPGTLPSNMLVEFAPCVLVLTIFLTYYELFDCMGVGLAKGSCQKGWKEMTYAEYGSKPMPEQVYLAQRVQTNQMEQFPVLLVAMVTCAIYVNGYVAALMALVWSMLRLQYAETYRGSMGATYGVLMGRIGSYTVPAYFVSNSMLMAAAVHALRCMVGS